MLEIENEVGRSKSVRWQEMLQKKNNPTIFAGRHLAGPALLPSILQLKGALESQGESLHFVTDAGLGFIFQKLKFKTIPLNTPQKGRWAEKYFAGQAGIIAARILGNLSGAYGEGSCNAMEMVGRCVDIINKGSNILIFPQAYTDVRGDLRWRIGMAKIIQELIPDAVPEKDWGFNVGLIKLNIRGITDINMLDSHKLIGLGVGKQTKPHNLMSILQREYNRKVN